MTCNDQPVAFLTAAGQTKEPLQKGVPRALDALVKMIDDKDDVVDHASVPGEVEPGHQICFSPAPLDTESNFEESDQVGGV